MGFIDVLWFLPCVCGGADAASGRFRLRLAREPQTSPHRKLLFSLLPDPKTPEEFFARARQLSDLEAAGIPFHLKATYVASGDTEFTGNGMYEQWWQSKDLWRKEATLGDYKYLEDSEPGISIRFMEARNIFRFGCGRC